MQEYAVTIWSEGNRWTEIVGSSNIKVLEAMYKRQYDRFKIEPTHRSQLWTSQT